MKVIRKIVQMFSPSKRRRFVRLRTPAYHGRHAGSDFLVVMSGPSIRSCESALAEFAVKKRLITIGCNKIPDTLVPDYHVFVNRRRFCDYGSDIKPESVPLLSPWFTRRQIEHVLGNRRYESVMFRNEYPSAAGHLSIDKGIISTEGATVGIIAIAVALVMGARNVYVAGMDGYSSESETMTHFYREHDDKNISELLQVESAMRQILDNDLAVILNNLGAQLKIITPTTYGNYYERIW